MRKPSFMFLPRHEKICLLGFLTRSDTNQLVHSKNDSLRLNILDEEINILSRHRETKAVISLYCREHVFFIWKKWVSHFMFYVRSFKP